MSRKTSEDLDDWLKEEINRIKRRLGLIEERTTLAFNEFQLDGITLSLFKMAYEELGTNVHEITSRLVSDNFIHFEKICDEIYFIMDIIYKLLISLRDGNLLGIEIFFTNVNSGLKTLKETLLLYEPNLNSVVVKKIIDFINDINLIADQTDMLFLTY